MRTCKRCGKTWDKAELQAIPKEKRIYLKFCLGGIEFCPACKGGDVNKRAKRDKEYRANRKIGNIRYMLRLARVPNWQATEFMSYLDNENTVATFSTLATRKMRDRNAMLPTPRAEAIYEYFQDNNRDMELVESVWIQACF